MNISELKKFLIRNLDRKPKNIEKETWDSLNHLNILQELEIKFPNKITKLKNIAEANSFKKLLQILLKSKIVSK